MTQEREELRSSIVLIQARQRLCRLMCGSGSALPHESRKCLGYALPGAQPRERTGAFTVGQSRHRTSDGEAISLLDFCAKPLGT